MRLKRQKLQRLGKLPPSKRKLREAVRKGTAVLADVDQRYSTMKRFRSLLKSHISDLGGEDQITHAEHVLATRASMLTTLAEMSEVRFAAQPDKIPVSALQSYMWTVSALTRILVALGLQRRAKDVSFGDILNADAARQQHASAERQARQREAFEQRQRDKAEEASE